VFVVDGGNEDVYINYPMASHDCVTYWATANILEDGHLGQLR